MSKILRNAATIPFDELLAMVKEKMSRQGRKEFGAYDVIALEISYRTFLINRGDGCERCTTREMLTLDHIIPLALLQEFGFPKELFFDVENYQLLCRRCNMYKSRRLDFVNPRTKPLLLKYIDTVPGIKVVQAAVYEQEAKTMEIDFSATPERSLAEEF